MIIALRAGRDEIVHGASAVDSMTSTIPKLEARNSTMGIYSFLRSEILNGNLAAGSPISQARIAREFKISRGPLREALRLLQQEGLVEVEVNQRARVSSFSVSDIEQFYAKRVVTEALAVAVSVPRLTRGDHEQIERYLDLMDSEPASNVAKWREHHRSFHFALMAKAGDVLLREIRSDYEYIDIYRSIFDFPNSHSWLHEPEEHRKIAQACIEGKAEIATKLLGRHIAKTGLNLLVAIAPEYEPVSIRASLVVLSSAV